MDIYNKDSVEQFSKLYLDRYGQEGETIQKCIDRVIQTGIISTEKIELEFFGTIVKEMLGETKYKSEYKMRNWGLETLGTKVTNELWLMYGPKILDKQK